MDKVLKYSRITLAAIFSFTFLSLNDAYGIKFFKGGPKHDDFNSVCKQDLTKIKVNVTRNQIDISNPMVIEAFDYSFSGISYPYNPSVLKIDSETLMTFRFDCSSQTKEFVQGYTGQLSLDKELFPKSDAVFLGLPSFKKNKLGKASHEGEDVRLFRHQNKVFALYNDTVDGFNTNWVSRRQHLVRIKKRGQSWEATGNVFRLGQPTFPVTDGPEKNWVPFSLGNELLFQYSFKPLQIVKISDFSSEEISTTRSESICRTQIPWDESKWGVLRGGTPAIKTEDGLLLSFFHSVKEHDDGMTYHLGAYTLDPKFYCVKEISPSPITWEGMYDFERGFWADQHDADVVFASGLTKAKYQDNESYLLSMGLNDSHSSIFVINPKRLRESLINSDEFFIQKLKNLPKEAIGQDEAVREYIETNKVYVSLTTSPTRLKYIDRVIDSLDLSLVDQVILTLPMKYGPKGEEYNFGDGTLDKVMKKYPKIHVLRPKTDDGPLSKLAPAADYLRSVKASEDAILITVDDDTAYPMGMIGQLTKSVALNPNTSFGSSTQPVSYWKFKNASHWSDGENTIVVEGFGGVGHRLGNLDTALMRSFAQINKDCFVSDDMTINFALDRAGVRRSQISNQYYRLSDSYQFPWGFGADALHKGGGIEDKSADDLNTSKYQRCDMALSTR